MLFLPFFKHVLLISYSSAYSCVPCRCCNSNDSFLTIAWRIGICKRCWFLVVLLFRNDYEMLLALDNDNDRHTGASAEQINRLPLSQVQVVMTSFYKLNSYVHIVTFDLSLLYFCCHRPWLQVDNSGEACAVCLETPSVGDQIRHLPCLHKFHKEVSSLAHSFSCYCTYLCIVGILIFTYGRSALIHGSDGVHPVQFASHLSMDINTIYLFAIRAFWCVALRLIRN